MTQKTINKQKEADEREYAFQADVDSIKLKLEYMEAEMKRQEQDVIPKNIRSQFEREISEWEKDSMTFVATRATHHIQKSLLFNDCVVVTGSSGCGKSSNIHHAALHLRDSYGYEIVPVLTGPTDIINYFNENKKQVFVVDDICGKETINTQSFMMWRDFSEQIEKIFRIADNYAEHQNDGAVLDVSHPKFLVSCRLHIFKESQFQLLTTLTKMECNLLSPELCLLQEERMCMIEKYLPEDISEHFKSELVKENIDFFPLLCKLSKDKTSEDVIKLFTAPVKSIKKNISYIISSEKTHFCAIVLCILFDDGFNTDWLKLKSVPEGKIDKLENILKSFEINVNNEMSRDILTSSFSTLNGTFIKQNGVQCRMIHDKIYKMAAVICGQRLTETFMHYAPSLFVRDHFIFESVTKNEANDDFIILSDDMEERYFERLLRDLSNSVITSTFNNKQLIYPSFISKLINFFQRSDEAIALLKLIDTEGCDMQCVNGDHNCESYINFFWSPTTTPLLESASSGYLDIVHFLIVSVKCNVNKVDRERGMSPLFKACKGGKTEVVKLLLDNNADVSLCDGYHTSPLYVACAGRYTDIVKLLLQKNADVSQCDSSGDFPLYMACERRYTDIVKLLLLNNADVSQCNPDKESSLYVACKEGYTDIVRLLLLNNANNSKSNSLGMCPLNVACAKGYIEIVELLLQNKADVSQLNNHGESALFVACKGGNIEIVHMLLQYNADVTQCNKRGDVPLYIACARRYTNIVKLLLQKNVNVSQCNPDGESSLYVACKEGYTDIVKQLLLNNAYNSKSNSWGMCPLNIACARGYIEIVELLLQNNVPVTKLNKHGESTLFVACKGGYTGIVKLILQYNDDVLQCSSVGDFPLYMACKGGYTDTVELLLLNNADVSQCNTDGESSLFVACEEGYTDIVRLLLLNKADVYLCNRLGASPLFAACEKGHSELVKLLLQNKADVFKSTNDGESPLYATCKGGFTVTFKLLLQRFADVSHCSKDGESPLHGACRIGCTDIVKLLLLNKVDVSLCNRWGQSPLYVACERGYKEEIIKLLLKNDADIFKCNNKGASPLYVACTGNCTDTVRLLLQNNADVSQCNIFGESPLYAACKAGCIDTVKLLIKSFADVSHCSSEGESPLYIACKKGYTDIVKLLLNNKADISQCEHQDGQSTLHVVCEKTGCDLFRLEYEWDLPILQAIDDNHLAHTGIVELLLSWNADVTKCNKQGQTPLDVARNAGCSETLALLEKHLKAKCT